jgi:hypothetical protein
MAHLRLIAFWIAVAAAVSVPDCQSTAPTQNTLIGVHTANLTVPGSPFGLVYASKDVGFAAIDLVSNNAEVNSAMIGVLNTSTFMPTLIREITVPAPFYQFSFGVTGLTITHNKQTLYVSVGSGAIAIDVEKAVSGEVDPIVGFLRGTVGTTSIEATLSSDDKYIFVSQEDGSNTTSDRGAIEVFNVNRVNNGSVLSTYLPRLHSTWSFSRRHRIVVRWKQAIRNKRDGKLEFNSRHSECS